MSKNRGDYVAAQERFWGNTSVRSAREDVTSFTHDVSIDRTCADGAAEEHRFEAEELAIDGKRTTT
jgi:hypothetical protein